MPDYKISSKRKDTGKWHAYGNIKQGEKGLRMGLKKTPELMELINEVEDGKYLNFLLFEDKPKESNPMNDGNEYMGGSDVPPF